MKYRLIAIALLLTALGGIAAITPSEPSRAVTTQPAGSDDAAMKSLSIN